MDVHCTMYALHHACNPKWVWFRSHVHIKARIVMVLTSSHLIKRSPSIMYFFTLGGVRIGVSTDILAFPPLQGWTGTVSLFASSASLLPFGASPHMVLTVISGTNMLYRQEKLCSGFQTELLICIGK